MSNERPRIGVRQCEFHSMSDVFERNTARVIYDPATESVYIEVVAKHDGVVVTSAVKVERAVFAHKLLNIGGLL